MGLCPFAVKNLTLHVTPKPVFEASVVIIKLPDHWWNDLLLAMLVLSSHHIKLDFKCRVNDIYQIIKSRTLRIISMQDDIKPNRTQLSLTVLCPVIKICIDISNSVNLSEVCDSIFLSKLNSTLMYVIDWPGIKNDFSRWQWTPTFFNIECFFRSNTRLDFWTLPSNQ